MRKFKKLSMILSLALIMSMMWTGFAKAAETYVVQPGDVLWKIAEQYDMEWKDLSDYNKLKNPHLIYPTQKLEIPESQVKISLLGTADLHGRIYAYDYATDSEDLDAGLAKIATLVKAERTENPNVILMDCGDTVQDNSAELFNDMPVHPMVMALNSLDFDTWTIGNHEFNFEKSFIAKNIEGFKNDVLAANIYNEDGTRFVKPYTIIEKDGVRVAVVGIMPPHVPVWEASSPSHFEGLTFTATVDEAKKVVKELEGKYDVLVGAFHLGKDGEHGYQGAVDIANACPEFDVMFLGHAHSKVNEEVNGVKLLEPGRYGWALAKAEVTLDRGESGWEISDITTENVETFPVAEDEEIKKEFATIHETSVKDTNIVVGNITEDFVTGVDYITGDAKVTTMPRTQIEDTALIDFINEVQMYYAEADISSAAAFKKDMNLLKGEFKKKDVANIYKYPNTLVGVNITGAKLKEYMEWSASYYNTYKEGDITVSFNPEIRGYNYDMFAGVTYDIDISKEAGSRISNLLFNGEPIDDTKVYKLAVNNYRFGTIMGLGYVTAEDKYYDSYELMQDAGRIRDLIIKYVADVKKGEVVPTCDHNWKIIGTDLESPVKDAVFQMIKDGTLEIPTSEDGRTPNIKSINVNELIEEGIIEEVPATEEASEEDSSEEGTGEESKDAA